MTDRTEQMETGKGGEMKASVGKKLTCASCNATFDDRQKLQEHEKSVHREASVSSESDARSDSGVRDEGTKD